MQSSRLLVATALVAMFAWSTAVSAQDGAPAAAAYADIDIELDVMPDDLARRLDQEPAAVIAADLGMQGAILATRRWNPGDVVTVCFWTGTQVLRQRIAQAAAPWNDAGANIRLDFGDANDPRLCRAGQTSDIRVGFGFPGYWSLLGRDSIISAGPNETTLNLANFNYVTPEESEFNRIVLHEFGHALGFIHEHQHPSASCEEEFNWPVIYTRLGGPPNNWPREKVDHNMRQTRLLRASDRNRLRSPIHHALHVPG